jgi:hypothetical protein
MADKGVFVASTRSTRYQRDPKGFVCVHAVFEPPYMYILCYTHSIKKKQSHSLGILALLTPCARMHRQLAAFCLFVSLPFGLVMIGIILIMLFVSRRAF